MITILQDHHQSAVIGLESYQGTPVLIHTAGRYPSILDDDGNQIDRYIDVVEAAGRYHVTGRVGYGYGGRLLALSVGSAEKLDGARDLYPAAQQAIEDAPAEYTKAREISNRFAPWAGPLSRGEYEKIAHELGFTPLPDNKISIWGDFTFPQYTLDDLPRLLTHQRRAYTRDREIKQATADAAPRQTSVATLRLHPVARRETRFVPTGLPDEFLHASKLHTVVSRTGRRVITEDDPAVHGSHLLGHEGETGEIIVLDIRE